MLDKNALSQLTELKQSIRADKNLTPGTVRGSQGRFGFVALDDGREAFLPPDIMARVLPGDRVEVALTEKPDSGKLEAELDKLLKSPTRTLSGQYIVRGKGHFVAVDMPQLNRWVFLPPRARGKAQEGDYLVCQLTRHPFEDGKAQAKVTEVLGKPGDRSIEHKVTCRKYQLPEQWPDSAQAQADTIAQQPLAELVDYSQRTPLQERLFVTIDSASTRDMDDALAIEPAEEGWRLSVAIADPTAAIKPGSPLDKAARQRASTAYLPGRAVSMLPEILANGSFSLLPGEERPALVCHMQIGNSGEIRQAEFEFAIIRSAHKLSYQQVSEYLQQDQSDAVPADTHNLLTTLADCSRALNAYRGQHMLLMEERDDYQLILNAQGQIADIQRQRRNLAQQVVEESMLAANRSAGDFFARHGGGIFSSHLGFRPERLDSIRAVIAEDFPQLAELDLQSLTGYQQLIRSLQDKQEPQAATLLAALRMMLQAGELTTTPAPHLGLAMPHYATITSPIRRYNDLHNHRALRALLHKQSIPDAGSLADLQQQLSVSRSASRDLEQWLSCLFIQQHAEQQKEASFTGQVFRVSAQGITVKLDDWGITGFVKLDPKAFDFDASRMTLSSDSGGYQLNQPLTVKVERVDLDKKRINFALATD